MAQQSGIKQKNKKKLETIFRKHKYKDYKWIDPKEIVVSQWVRTKCMFGCSEFGNNASCPPNTPSVAECERFFHEYDVAAIFRFATKVPKPEDRHAWTKKINLKLLKLEREVFVSGYERAFLLFMDSCGICAECTGERATCKEHRLSRPSPESMAVDVFTTVRKYGYDIEVLAEYSEKMNRFAFLMIA